MGSDSGAAKKTSALVAKNGKYSAQKVANFIRSLPAYSALQCAEGSNKKNAVLILSREVSASVINPLLSEVHLLYKAQMDAYESEIKKLNKELTGTHPS